MKSKVTVLLLLVCISGCAYTGRLASSLRSLAGPTGYTSIATAAVEATADGCQVATIGASKLVTFPAELCPGLAGKITPGTVIEITLGELRAGSLHAVNFKLEKSKEFRRALMATASVAPPLSTQADTTQDVSEGVPFDSPSKLQVLELLRGGGHCDPRAAVRMDELAMLHEMLDNGHVAITADGRWWATSC